MINFYRGALVNSNIQYLCRALCRILDVSHVSIIGGGTRYLFWGGVSVCIPFQRMFIASTMSH